MRRVALILGAVLTVLAVSSPAQAYAHDRVANPAMHAVLDVLTLAIVTAPLWTAYFWGKERRTLMLALMGIVQIPAAVFAFVPIPDPVLHVVALSAGLTVTATSIWYVRAAARARRPVPVADR
ncbi:hypothetical protein AB0I28_03805 [Phytomonospora sp. NPDC050363]|uniref:hypothetical protein n=1 Tax=Phytomonospora sp. NPDC050363 TaxID=3155642 RepID=UPI0033DE13D5